MAISPMNNTPTQKFYAEEHTADKMKREKLEQAKKNNPYSNPMAQLDKDAFMHLLLQELKYQDPTSPMDSDKMLTQTSQLASLETQEKTNRTMEALAKKMELMSDSMGVGMIGAVGKIASLKKDGYEYDGKSGSLQFNIMIPQGFATDEERVKITMFDEKDQEVASMNAATPALTGNNNFLFDMRSGEKDANGNPIMLPKGNYKFVLSYTDKHTGQQMNLTSTDFLITGVRMKDGKANFLAGGVSVGFNEIAEFRDPQL